MPTLTFKVTDEEARRIRELARRRQLTVSEYLRRQAQAGGRRSARVQRLRCPLTGALIFGLAPSLPPLTSRTVRQMLAEFP